MTKRILVVEDNQINRMLVADVLRHYGYEVIEAVNGVDGVRAAREERPDLILLDMHMPVMDGLAALKVLKGDPETRDIKILAVTSFAMRGDREKFLEAGADDYISKPIDTRRLPGIVKALLGSREGGT